MWITRINYDYIIHQDFFELLYEIVILHNYTIKHILSFKKDSVKVTVIRERRNNSFSKFFSKIITFW